MRCATTSLRYCNLRHGEYLLSNHDEWWTDNAGKTTTAHHTRSGKHRNSGEFSMEEETFVFLNIVIKLVICAVAVIPTSKKIISQRENVRNTLLGDAPFHSSLRIRHENEIKNSMRIENQFFLLKHFMKLKVADFASRERLACGKNIANKERKSKKW